MSCQDHRSQNLNKFEFCGKMRLFRFIFSLNFDISASLRTLSAFGTLLTHFSYYERYFDFQVFHWINSRVVFYICTFMTMTGWTVLFKSKVHVLIECFQGSQGTTPLEKFTFLYVRWFPIPQPHFGYKKMEERVSDYLVVLCTWFNSTHQVCSLCIKFHFLGGFLL